MEREGILVPTPILYLSIQLNPIGIDFIFTLWLKVVISHYGYGCMMLAGQNLYLFCLQQLLYTGSNRLQRQTCIVAQLGIACKHLPSLDNHFSYFFIRERGVKKNVQVQKHHVGIFVPTPITESSWQFYPTIIKTAHSISL